MPMLPLLFALIATPAPDLSEAKIFGDWVVACDNTRHCEMNSLYPGDEPAPEENSGYNAAISIERAAGPDGGFIVEVGVSAKGGATVRIDNVVIAKGGEGQGDFTVFRGADAARIVAAMVNGKDLRVTNDNQLERATLSGSSAALRFMDAAQGRVGTVTAAVAKGAKPASAVPAAVAPPPIRFVRPGGTPATITKAMRAIMEKRGDCAEVYAGGEGDPPAVEAYALGGGKTLALIPCGSGAYNFDTVPFIVSGGTMVPAKFDYAPGDTDATDGIAMLINAGWDEKTAKLTSYDKGRGIGDCGAGQDYVWDGTMFRLVEATQMPDCRGSYNWLTVWRATPVAQ